MSKKKGKDKNKVDNKPAYFDFTTLRLQSLKIILLSTSLTAAGAYTPMIFLVSILLLLLKRTVSRDFCPPYFFRYTNPSAWAAECRVRVLSNRASISRRHSYLKFEFFTSRRIKILRVFKIWFLWFQYRNVPPYTFYWLTIPLKAAKCHNKNSSYSAVKKKLRAQVG